MCLGSPLEGQHRGAAKNSREYYREGVVSVPTPKCPSVTQKSSEVMWLVLGPHLRNSHTQGRLGCPKSSHGCPGGVEPVLGLH